MKTYARMDLVHSPEWTIDRKFPLIRTHFNTCINPNLNPNSNFDLKGRVHCFSMQVVMTKCFLLNPDKNMAQIRLVVFEKNAKNAHFNSKT